MQNIADLSFMVKRTNEYFFEPWKCPKCTFVNIDLSLKACEICLYPVELAAEAEEAKPSDHRHKETELYAEKHDLEKASVYYSIDESVELETHGKITSFHLAKLMAADDALLAKPSTDSTSEFASLPQHYGEDDSTSEHHQDYISDLDHAVSQNNIESDAEQQDEKKPSAYYSIEESIEMEAHDKVASSHSTEKMMAAGDVLLAKTSTESTSKFASLPRHYDEDEFVLEQHQDYINDHDYDVSQKNIESDSEQQGDKKLPACYHIDGSVKVKKEAKIRSFHPRQRLMAAGDAISTKRITGSKNKFASLPRQYNEDFFVSEYHQDHNMSDLDYVLAQNIRYKRKGSFNYYDIEKAKLTDNEDLTNFTETETETEVYNMSSNNELTVDSMRTKNDLIHFSTNTNSCNISKWSANDLKSWRCTSCTYMNTNPMFLKCEMCGQDRPLSEQSLTQDSMY